MKKKVTLVWRIFYILSPVVIILLQKNILIPTSHPSTISKNLLYAYMIMYLIITYVYIKKFLKAKLLFKDAPIIFIAISVFTSGIFLILFVISLGIRKLKTI